MANNNLTSDNQNNQHHSLWEGSRLRAAIASVASVAVAAAGVAVAIHSRPAPRPQRAPEAQVHTFHPGETACIPMSQEDVVHQRMYLQVHDLGQVAVMRVVFGSERNAEPILVTTAGPGFMVPQDANEAARLEDAGFTSVQLTFDANQSPETSYELDIDGDPAHDEYVEVSSDGSGDLHVAISGDPFSLYPWPPANGTS